MIDRRESAAAQEFEKWLSQAADSAILAKSFAWLIVYRRNQREAVACWPSRLQSVFTSHVQKGLERCGKFVTMRLDGQAIHFCPLDDFLDHVTPGEVAEVAMMHGGKT